MSLDLAAVLDRLTGEERAALDKAVRRSVTERWIPQEGPQTEAYFSPADETLFGGSAGGGKSDLLVGLALNAAHNAVIFRNGLGNVRDLENRAISVMGHRDGFNGQFHYWDLGQGRSLEFGSLEQPGSEQNWQGRRRDFMGFDEAAQIPRERIQFVLGWAGSAVPGVRTRIVYATNPPLSDEGNWLISWFAPWLDPLFDNPAGPGELRWFVNNRDGDPVWVAGPGTHDDGAGNMLAASSRTFIPSRLSDNRFLRDTGYRARVEKLPEPMRSAMLNGNFMAARVDHERQVFPSDWVAAAQRRWTEDGRKRPMLALGVDVAGGGADREVIARLHVGNWFDVPLVHRGLDTKDGHAVAGRIVAAQRNSAPVNIDLTGGWGGGPKTALSLSEVDVSGTVFSEVSGAVDAKTGIPYANLRAELMWNFREALDPQSGEDIALPPDAKLAAELATPRWELRGARIIIEGKDDIKKRLGVSTDLLESYMLAWWIRGRGLQKRSHGPRSQAMRQVEHADPFAIDRF